MIPMLLCALVAAIVAAPLPEGGGRWPSPATRCEDMSAALHIATALRPIVVDMCRRAPTFRHQVARLASAPALDVTVERAPIPRTATWQAQTAMTRVAGHLRSADVLVPTGQELLVVEMLAHEFEHILEQLDGVDLKRWAGRAGVYRLGASSHDGPFETERARQVGRLVAGEYAAAAAEITAFKVQ